MNLPVYPAWRCHTAAFDPKPTPEKLRQLILDEQDIARQFVTLHAPRPALDDTWVKLIGNDRTLIVGVCALDSIPWLTNHIMSGLAENIEIMINPWNDDLGYVQYIFGTPPKYATAGEPHRDPDPIGDVQVNLHTPYAEAHSSAFKAPRLRKHAWDDEVPNSYNLCGYRMRWLFAWFDTSELFARGDVAGFNICRNRPAIDEFSSWTFCAGNGGPDPQGFGRLYRFKPPVELQQCQAQWDGQTLRVEGRASQPIKSLRFRLEDLSESSQTVDAEVTSATECRLTVRDLAPQGRLRLYPSTDSGAIEPRYIAVDLPRRRRAARFTISVLCDTPDDLLHHPYTPQRLDDEMKLWSQLGVGRIHTIDYSNWPSFWQEFHLWRKQYGPTMKALSGNFPAAYAKAAHDHGMEMISDLKTFDISAGWLEAKDRRSTTAPEVDKRRSSVVPEIAAHPEWTMQAHPDLRREAKLPIRTLRLYSLQPIPNLRQADVEVLTSKDNRKYALYRRPFKVTVRAISRPHQRWTPTGIVPDRGSARNWMLQIDGLELREPFAAVRIKKRDIDLVQRGFMVVEAIGPDESPQPVTIATNGKCEGGFYMWRGWQGWNNVTEALLTERKWFGREFGFVFRVADNMPTLLEPAYEGARRIWLGRLGYLLDSGADGVCIRTYQHHNGPMCYLQYVYAAPVIEAFRAQIGRDPQNTPADYKIIREIRRDAYGQFMRDASRLARGMNKKFMFELESGAEVGSEYDCRMQLPMDWQRWMREGLLDEIRLKNLTGQCRFAHEQVLPLARKHGVAVSIISRCLHTGVGMRTTEMARHAIAGAAAAGFDGYTLYEHQSLMDISPVGRAIFKGPVELFVSEARAALKELATPACGGE